MEPSKRWPDRVYGVGEEPDPRFTLANERTFLAWVRTSLALIAGAAAIDALTLPMPPRVQALLAVALATAGLLAVARAWVGWTRTERAMRLDLPLPGNGTGVLLAGLIAVVGLGFLVVAALRVAG